MTTVAERAARIRLALFDVDGVMTDGRLYLAPGGVEMKAFHVRDGHGLKRLMEAGIEVGVISGRPSQATQERLRDLGVAHVFLAVRDKRAVLDELLTSLGLTPPQTAFMGDDLPDLPVMQHVGLALTVADAHEAVLACAHWVSTLPGGQGAVREACDWLLNHPGGPATP